MSAGRLIAGACEELDGELAAAGRAWRDDTARRYGAVYHAALVGLLRDYARAVDQLEAAIEHAEAVAASS